MRTYVLLFTRTKIGLAWWLILLALLWASYSHAASLTTAQLGVLKQHITTSADLADELAAGNMVDIALAMNLQATPDFWVWKTTLRQYDIYSLPSPTGSNWNWTQYKTLKLEEQATWKEMFTGAGAITNYSLDNIRAGVTALFAGSPTNTDQKTHIDAHGRRLVSRAERLYTTGTGSPAAPGKLAWEGTITSTDVATALALP